MKPTVRSRVFVAIAALCLTGQATALPTNKQLTIGLSQEFENLNPVIMQMMASTTIYSLVARPLISIDADWHWKCWLCTKIPTPENGMVKIISAKDGTKKLEATWELDPKAVWGDGVPVTGHDVKLSWEIGLNPNVSVGQKDMYERIENITVDAANPKKFTMFFKEARYDYYQLGTLYLLPAHIEGPIFEKAKGASGSYEKLTAYSTDPTNAALYNGPYVVKEIKLGSHIVVERNPKFSGKRPAIDRIVFKYIPNSQTLEANLLSGSVDFIDDLGLSLDQVLAFTKREQKEPDLKKKYRVEIRDGMVYEHIDFNLRNPVLADLKVRQALAHAIDLDKLTQALFEGKQKKALHNVHPLDVYYTEDVTKYPHDAAKSAQLLDQAGWLVGPDKFRYKSGQRLKLTLMTTAGNKTRELIEVWLQGEWKKAGIDLEIKNEPARVYFGETLKKGLFPHMAMFAWVSSPDNPPKSTLQSSEIPTEKNGFSGQNAGAYQNAEVDKLLTDIQTEFNLEKRKVIMKKVLQFYTAELPTLPLYYRAVLSIVPANLTGFKLTGHQFPATLNAEDWELGPAGASH